MKDDYEKTIELRKQTAQIIWDNAFLTSLPRLTREQLYGCIFTLLDKLDEEILCKNDFDCIDERDWKDIVWDKKCLLIKCLDEDFFNSGDEKRKIFFM